MEQFDTNQLLGAGAEDRLYVQTIDRNLKKNYGITLLLLKAIFSKPPSLLSFPHVELKIFPETC